MPVLAMILGFVAMVIMSLSAVAVAVVRLIRGPRGAARETSAEEARAMQELHKGLSRMEQRIEALETILLEREGEGSQR